MSKAPVVLPRVGLLASPLLKTAGGKGQQERGAAFAFAEALAPSCEIGDVPAGSQRPVPPAPVAPLTMLSAEMAAAAVLAPISMPCDAPKGVEPPTTVAHDDRSVADGRNPHAPKTRQPASPPIPRPASAGRPTPDEPSDTRETEQPVSPAFEPRDFASPESRIAPDAPAAQVISLSTHHAPAVHSLAPRLAEVIGAVAKDMAAKGDVRPEAADASVRPISKAGTSSVRAIVLQLSPAELGAIKVSVRATGSIASVEIAVTEHDTVNAVQAARESIVEAVRDAGFDAASVAVSYAAPPREPPGAAQFSEGPWHGENHDGRRRRDDRRERSRARSPEEPRIGAAASRVV